MEFRIAVLVSLSRWFEVARIISTDTKARSDSWKAHCDSATEDEGIDNRSNVKDSLVTSNQRFAQEHEIFN